MGRVATDEKQESQQTRPYLAECSNGEIRFLLTKISQDELILAKAKEVVGTTQQVKPN